VLNHHEAVGRGPQDVHAPKFNVEIRVEGVKGVPDKDGRGHVEGNAGVLGLCTLLWVTLYGDAKLEGKGESAGSSSEIRPVKEGRVWVRMYIRCLRIQHEYIRKE